MRVEKPRPAASKPEISEMPDLPARRAA